MTLLLRTARPKSADDLPALAKELEAAAFLGIEPKKLRRLCYERRGPASIKIGRDRVYPRHGLSAWIAERQG